MRESHLELSGEQTVVSPDQDVNRDLGLRLEGAWLPERCRGRLAITLGHLRPSIVGDVVREDLLEVEVVRAPGFVVRRSTNLFRAG